MKNFKNLRMGTLLSFIVILIGTFIPVSFFGEENIDLYFSISTYVIMFFLLAMAAKFIVEKNEAEKLKETEDLNRVQGKILHNLNDKDVYLVDYENTACLPKEIEDENLDAVFYLFINHELKNRLKNEMMTKRIYSKCEIFVSDHSGRNFNDIGIGMYIGSIYALYNPRKIVIFSKDRGYDSVIQFAEDMGYHNLFIKRPEEEVILTDREIRSIFKRVSNINSEKTISLGTLKKRVRNSRLNIKPDEVNYAVKQMEKLNLIEIVDCGNYKNVIFNKQPQNKQKRKY